MNYEQAHQLAEKWLLENGFAKYADGTWHFEGYEALLDSALAQYIQQQVKKENQ